MGDELSDAGSGAAAGSMIGPYGALIGGAAGLAYGLFANSATPPSYSNINLQQANPDLYNSLQQLKAVSNEYDRLYALRRQGPTAMEMQQLNDSRGQLRSQLANRGLIGSSAGNQLESNFEQQQNNNISNRIFNEENQLNNERMQSSMQYNQANQLAQQQAYNAAYQQYLAQQQQNQGRNQFFSGLFGAGLKMSALPSIQGAYGQGMNFMSSPNTQGYGLGVTQQMAPMNYNMGMMQPYSSYASPYNLGVNTNFGGG